MIFFSLKVDLFGSILFFIVLIMTIVLGNFFHFYENFFWWDRLSHFLFGIVSISFGVAIAHKLGFSNKFSIVLFSFTFAITLQTFWEVFEYLTDLIFHTNNQRWKGETVANAQPAGLVDTMNDTIFYMVGSLITCLVRWFR